MPLVFDSNAFLQEHFEGIEGVINLLAAHEVDPPNKAAVDKWLTRRSIPGEWLPKLLFVAGRQARRPIDIAKYMRK